ncbi:MAG: Na+/H+ antiporter NhaA [Candidatus Schekmanbacteria bacterium]|nr:Na+/H+ antiporter NhaA [Candidatus Schekmanbacteria bacterium]
MTKPTSPPSHPPELWVSARRFADYLARPLDRFLQIEAASGILLLATTAIALAWANSPWSASYEHLWHTPITFGIGKLSLTQPLHFLINDGLMVVFFFVVGLEIRREIHEGELSEAKRAALPVAAALGGMVVPALIYSALNWDPAARRGWGVPMATDIAFAVGVLTLLGKRVPAAIRVLLLALAIIDDIGAIVVIALFYSAALAWSGLALAVLGVAGVIVMAGFGVRRAPWYILPGAVLWGGLWVGGVHPTIGGVILGLLTPVRSWYGTRGFLATAERAIEDFRRRATRDHAAHDLVVPLSELEQARREAVAPVVRLEAALHGWVAFGIMPIFALANAGVDLSGVSFGTPGAVGVVLGVTLGLVLGKPIGIVLASFLAVRLGLAALPRGVTWLGVGVVGVVAAIGFTMAIFIAGLAFTDPQLLGIAKLGVLVGSTVAGILGLLAGRMLLSSPEARDDHALTPADAEASTEH